MRVLYVLPTTEFGGGIKVAFEHAELLRRLGHEVTVMAPGPRPSWTDFGGEYRSRASEGAAQPLMLQDLVIATFWTTVEEAIDLEVGPVAHFCQGYEGALEHLAHQRAEIEAAYRRELPTLVVNPTLGEMLEKTFSRAFRVVPPPVDARFHPIWRWKPRSRPRVVLPGIFEAPVKGVAWALEALRQLEGNGLPCTLVRISMLEMTAVEAGIREADVYLQGVSPQRVAAQLRQSDLLLLPSRADEGFGLPLLEAMASKVPAVAAEIGSTRFMAPRGVELVPFGEVAAMAERAEAVLRSPRRWRQMRRQAFSESKRFTPERVARMLEDAVTWAAARGAEPRRAPSPEAPST